MASIIKKKIRGQIYYYAVESKRVDGKPRIVWQKYLGKVTDIVKALSSPGTFNVPQSIKVYSFGAEAALLAIARRLGLADIINRHTGWSGEGLSAGEHLLLLAINISLAPETRLSEWIEGTMLKSHFNTGARMLTEKRFLNAADLLTPASIQEIQKELSRRVHEEFGLDPGVIVHKEVSLPSTLETPFYRTKLAEYHLGLITTSQFMVPLFFEIYPGDLPEGKGGDRIPAGLVESLSALGLKAKDVTVVDHELRRMEDVKLQKKRGENYYHQLYLLDPEQEEDLHNLPLERFRVLRPGRSDRTKVYRASKRIEGKNYSIVLVYREKDYALRLEETKASLRKCFSELRELKWRLENSPDLAPLSGNDKLAYCQEAINRILFSNHQRSLVNVSVEVIEAKEIRLSYRINNSRFDFLREKVFGRTLLITDNEHWGNEEICSAFFGRSEIEEAFERMKIRPAAQPVAKYDSRLGVYIFLLTLALTLQSLLRVELYRCGVVGSLPEILRMLSEIRQVAVTYASGGSRSKRKEYLTVSELNPKLKEIYDCLHLNQFEAEGGTEDT